VALLPTSRDSTTMTAVPPADAPALLLTGPARHGVVRYARDVADEVRLVDPGVAVVQVSDPVDLVEAASRHPRVHLHVTDRLLGRGPEEAAALVERVADVTRLTVTLHDVPQASDGVVNLPRRVSCYARVAAAAAGVVVNSRHEALLLVEHGVLPADRAVAVIPLGTSPARVLPVVTGPRPTGLVALVAGYVYPGKGHDDVVRAVAVAADRLRAAGHALTEVAVVAVGGPSAGHEHDVDALRAEADRRGVDLRVTGSLDDEAFRAALRGPGIPVAAHQHLSASRTLLDWGEQGRRPLVVGSRYAREMAALRPGTLTPYPPELLPDALVRAWLDPASTALPPGTDLAPTLADVAAAYRAWWAGA
jgi:glycosyltransferase involved in cell wall biosynthesis